MKEGSTEAPIRHPLDWQSADFYDEAALDAEMRRQFDVCHGCRRCFNLCDSFPRLFDLIDESASGELDSVASEDFPAIVDACTLCDMCFMTKCPYVPPHEFNLDFPHLMLRHRAVALAEAGKPHFVQNQLAQMDRNGKALAPIAPLANWGAKRDNWLTRPALHAVAGIDRHAELPRFAGQTFMKRIAGNQNPPNQEGGAFGRKAVLYATCAVNYNAPQVGEAAARVLTHLGVATRADYPGCCGMPYLEQGNIAKVAEAAVRIAGELRPLIDEGYDILTLTASCGLMFKFEWPLIVPDNDDVKVLSAASKDICEYVVGLARQYGLGTLPALPAPQDAQHIMVHLACHARAQNMGAKAAELLRLLPDVQLSVIERCSGHGGTFGVLKETRPLAVKVGTPAARQLAKSQATTICSDCPLAAKHLAQLAPEVNKATADAPVSPETPRMVMHPIEVFARGLGVME